MSSDLSDEEILDLVSKTESNFKRIENYNGDFVCVALNEWRYATRHIVEMMCKKDEQTNRTQAICHLKRAYFDSYDILIDSILSRFEELHSEYCDYSSIVKNYVEDYAKKISMMREAKEIHRHVSESENRDQFYDRISTVCEQADAFVNELESTADDWRSEIRQTVKKDRWIALGIMAAVASAIFAGLPFVIELFKKLSSN